MSRDKIVPINDANKNKVAMNAQLDKLPLPLQRVREHAQDVLKAAMQVLFDHVDDSLFELADRAATNFEQNLYFESMREIRIHRRQIEAEFSDGVDFSFVKLIDPEADLATYEGSESDKLALIEKDELEEMVAVDTMVNKVNNHTKEALQSLTSSMNTIVLVPVTGRNNPLSPRLLSDCFLRCSRNVKVDIKAKLVLFKLFERHVLGQIKLILEEASQILRNAGVVPGKEPAKVKQENPSSQVSASVISKEEKGEAGLLSTLHSLLSNDQGDAERLSKVLFNALSHLQYQQLDNPVASGKPQLLPSAQIGRSIGEYSGQQALDNKSEDVIKLVDMLFEFILEDRNLADPMKALLARLQIPIIKVALADPSFFNKGGHPARRLLNEMATAALGWEDGRKKDPLYRKISQIIERVLKEFDRNIELFGVLLEDFTQFIEKERHRASILEQRTLDEEDGKAKAEVGRNNVSEELDRIIGGKTLPAVAEKLLRGPWANVMFLVHMRHGGDSEAWQRAVETASLLVWSMLPVTDQAHREKLMAALPALLKSVRRGLEGISYNPSEQSELLCDLENTHLEILKKTDVMLKNTQHEEEDFLIHDEMDEVNRGSEIKPEPQVEPEVKAKPEPKVEPKVKPEPKVELEAKAKPEPKPEAKVEPEVKAKPEPKPEAKVEPEAKAKPEPKPEAKVEPEAKAKPEPKPEAKVEPEVKAQAEPKPDTVKPEATSTQKPEFTEQELAPHFSVVDRTAPGTWFERVESGASYRCKMATLIKATGKYIFINRNGVKVCEETRDSFALALADGSLRSLDDGMLFDRALESVITNLRTSKNKDV